jgi:hypothetical protein
MNADVKDANRADHRNFSSSSSSSSSTEHFFDPEDEEQDDYDFGFVWRA